MRRRDFIAALGSATAAWPIAALGQQQALPVVGWLSLVSADALPTLGAAWRKGLNENGYVEGRNFVVEYRRAEGHNERLPALVADLVQRRVKVIVATNVDAALAAKAATATIPIVFQTGSDPVKAGLVDRLNRPGGNITGISNFATALSAKRLGLLQKLVPKVASIGILIDPKTASSETQKAELQEAAQALGLHLVFLSASDEQEIDAAFVSLRQQRIGALLLTDSTVFNVRREQLAALARFNGVAMMCTFREFAVAGGLMSYAPSLSEAMRRTGTYVARILNGEKPSDLPVELASKFEFIINLKTARTLDLAIPPTLLALADEVIE
jgi:putative tryptophan/tyrosine transport system substrate-binding protein